METKCRWLPILAAGMWPRGPCWRPISERVSAATLLSIPTSWNIKMWNGQALHLNDGEERCAQGACPESGREDCHRPLNQKRSVEVIKGKERPWEKKSQWPERSLIVSNCEMLTCCDYFKHHWCVLGMTGKTGSCTFGFAPSFEN